MASIELDVDYKNLNAFFADYAKNIARGGTFIRTEKALGIGTEFTFKVQWVVKKEDATAESPAGMGIGFIHPSEVARRAMEVAVEQLMTKELGPHIVKRLLKTHTNRINKPGFQQG